MSAGDRPSAAAVLGPMKARRLREEGLVVVPQQEVDRLRERADALEEELLKVGCMCGPDRNPDPDAHRSLCTYRNAIERVEADDGQ